MQLLFPWYPAGNALRPRRTALRASFFALAWVLAGGLPALGEPAEAGGDRIPPGWAGRVSLEEVAEQYGLDWGEAPDGNGIALRRGALCVRFLSDHRRAIVTGVTVWLQHPFRRDTEGRGHLARVDVEAVLDPLLRAYRHLSPRPVRTIVLDPGHGGADGGAEGPEGLLEKNVVLDLAQRLRVRLEAEGFRVHLTREDDTFVSLGDRVRLAEERHADLFLSLHVNGWKNPEVRGIETYVLSKAGYPSTNSGETGSSIRHRALSGNRHDGANLVLGYHLQRRMLEHTATVDRGLRHARFQVLRDAPCPAALVECGFITHPEEAALFRDDAHLDRLAQRLAEGLRDYTREADRARLVSW